MNTMCALQPKNRLWLLLLSTVYVENIETICELCVCSFFTTDASNWHLWATGCSALADHIWAGSLSDCTAHWQMPPGSAHGISQQRCAGQSIAREESLTAQL